MNSLGEKFRIQKEKVGNSEYITITVPKILEAKELYWLREYGITEFDKGIVDLSTGQAVLKASAHIEDL